MAALKSKCAIAESDLKLAEQRAQVQSRWIFNLEKRLASACSDCREKDPDLTMISRENCDLMEVKEMLMKQTKIMEELARGKTPQVMSREEKPL